MNEGITPAISPLSQGLAIMLGGAFGALGRYSLVSLANHTLGKDFPYGTLLVNSIGSLLLGLLSVWLFEKVVQINEFWRLLLIVGFLGAFTTFSTFSLETFNLFMQGHTFRAFFNIIVNVCLCLAAVWLGIQTAQLIKSGY